MAQQSAMEEQTTATGVFRIGYLRQDPEAQTSSGLFDRLGIYVLDLPNVKTAMAEEGIGEILPQSYDSHRLLVEAMDGEQVDLAFCSAVDYADQRGAYEPIFQIKRFGDAHRSASGRRVWHSGVIFVNNRSSLFSMKTSAAVAQLPKYLETHGMAMVGISSAAGYIYPYLSVSRLTTSTQFLNRTAVFWESSAEVVKAVVNGIHEIGACDAGAIDEVLKAYGLLDRKEELIKEILRTDPVPRDPVVIHERWWPAATGGLTARQGKFRLGPEIARGVQNFFERNPSLPKMERSSREPFVELRQNLKRFEELKRGSADSDSRFRLPAE